jgi:hypothetical protein
MDQEAPLLPAWATEEAISEAVETLVDYEIKYTCIAIDQEVQDTTPKMIAEAEALLKHEAEGW